MDHSLSEIAEATGLVLVGDGSLRVDRPAEPGLARAGDLALAMTPRYADELAGSEARAAVIWPDADWQTLGLDGALIAPRPRVALAGVTETFCHPPDVSGGIHPTAWISKSAKIGEGAAIGPFVTIGDGASIGDRAIIGAHASIGRDASIGDRALLHAGARIGARCQIGDDFIAQPNAVIGADGFSFEPPERGNVESVRATGSVGNAPPTSRLLRIHSLAAVEIGNDVEVGAASTIDRGTIAPTRIGDGTKIDNQVQVGHNVQIGRTCMICAQVGLAGSARVGDRVVLGGKTGVADHVKIGSDVVCAGSTMVATNIPDRSVMMGIPAMSRAAATEQIMALRRLPRFIRQLAELRDKVGL